MTKTIDAMEIKVRGRLNDVIKEQRKSIPPYESMPSPRQPPWWIEKMHKLSYEELILRRLLD